MDQTTFLLISGIIGWIAFILGFAGIWAFYYILWRTIIKMREDKDDSI